MTCSMNVSSRSGTPDTPTCVFVVGMNGSGTTMLLDCLGRHSALYAFPVESRIIPAYLRNADRFGDLSSDSNFERALKAIFSEPVFRRINDGRALPPATRLSGIDRSMGGVFDAAFRSFAKRENKTIWCEKTPQHVQHIAMLSRAFPGAKFVHLIRDGRDCAASFQRRWRRSPVLSIYRWKKVVTMGRGQGRAVGPERYLEVRFEDLTGSPDVWMARVCAFIGVPFEASVLESSQPYLKADSPASSAIPGLRPNSGNWQVAFSTAGLRRLESVAGQLLDELGYPTTYSDGDKDLSKPGRLLRSSLDAVRQFGHEIYRKATGQIARPWSRILSKPVQALRHRRENRY